MDTTNPSPGTEAAGNDTAKAQQEAARLANAQIRAIAEGEVLSLGIEAEKYAFMCECGCGENVEVALAAYDADGAWIDGHR